jgi:hypothetical protein
MNERIKKLADKIWSLDVEPNPHFQLCLQAFAESIVQECAGMSENHVSVKDMYEGAPPETHKPWVGLTDEQIHNTAGYQETREMYSFVRAIEDKLKEKNYG